MTRGRKPITGRYETREELERMVCFWYSLPGHSFDSVAKICKVSAGTVQKILNQPKSAGDIKT